MNTRRRTRDKEVASEVREAQARLPVGGRLEGILAGALTDELEQDIVGNRVLGCHRASAAKLECFEKA